MAATANEVSTNGLVDTKQSRPAKRRDWPEDLKRQMVAETLEAGSSVSIVARRCEHQPAVQMAAGAAAEGTACGDRGRPDGAGRDCAGAGASPSPASDGARWVYRD